MTSYCNKSLLGIIACICSVIFAVHAYEPNKKYCDPSLCHGKKHASCNDTPTTYDDKCSIDAGEVTLTKDAQTYLLETLNEMRNRVARGGFNGLKAATRMETLVWHDELAHMAGANVRKCKLTYDACRNTKDFKSVGQSVGYSGLKGKVKELDEILGGIAQLWFSEQKSVTMKDIMNYRGARGKPKDNFLQLVLDISNKVGCAVLQQSKNGWLQTFLTCNYAHAPVVGQPIFTTGSRPGESCKSGMNPTFEYLCAAEDQTAGNDTASTAANPNQGEDASSKIDESTAANPNEGEVTSPKTDESTAANPNEGEVTSPKTDESTADNPNEGEVTSPKVDESTAESPNEDDTSTIASRSKKKPKPAIVRRRTAEETPGESTSEASTNEGDVTESTAEGDVTESTVEGDLTETTVEGEPGASTEPTAPSDGETLTETSEGETDTKELTGEPPGNVTTVSEGEPGEGSEADKQSSESIFGMLKKKFDRFLGWLKKKTNSKKKRKVVIITSNHEVDVDNNFERSFQEERIAQRSNSVRISMRSRNEPIHIRSRPRRNGISSRTQNGPPRTKHHGNGVAKWLAVRR